MLRQFLLVFCLLAVALVPSGWPQMEDASSNGAGSAEKRQPHWTNTLEEIKGDVDHIMKENNQLQAEYNTLKERILDVQTSINTNHLENQKIEADVKRTKRLISQEQLTRDAMGQKLERLTQEALNSQAKIDALKEQLGTYDEKMRLLTLQINDLELEKKQVDLELQAQEQLQRDLESGQAEELKKLREQVAAAQNQSADASQATQEQLSSNQRSQQELDRLNTENNALEEKIAELQQQKEEQLKLNEESRQKLGQDGMSDKYAQKLKEKKTLENEIVKLESQLADVKRSVEDSLEIQNKRRGLLDQILSLDKENRELRKKISDLKAQAATTQQDPAPSSQ